MSRLLAPCLALFPLLLAGCQPARRYPQPPAPARQPARAVPLPANQLWLEPAASTQDVPIVFVAAGSAEWAGLPHFWNRFPPPLTGTATAHLGQSPLGAALALLVLDRLDVVKIKVPLGLPDPTPLVPAANPPALLKWKLGKRLFFDPELLPARDGGSCARCHIPERGFTLPFAPPGDTLQMHPPSLLNCVYNRSQFWDGRVRALEEVIGGALASDQPGVPGITHAWPGLVARLRGSKEYRGAFMQAFAIRQPTLDATAKALAIYLRTLLSGNSLFDQAVSQAGKRGPYGLKVEDFAAVLDDEGLERLGQKGATRQETARALWTGWRLFHGDAGCARCHGGPTFTNHGFHNIGIRESEYLAKPGEEAGRFHWLAVGLKDARLIGAFRTPTLRNLPRTGPYFHDGSAGTVEEAVQFFNRRLDARFNDHLDPLLLTGPRTAQRLDLHLEDVRALALFLRALDGETVAAILGR
jgi:cytochrome c peroxidase